MGFWIVDLLLPVTMIGLSCYYKKKEDGRISQLSGFRTKNSMESKEQWKRAHKLSANYLRRAGIILVLGVIIIKIIAPLQKEILSLIDVGISMVVFIGITIYVNCKLKY